MQMQLNFTMIYAIYVTRSFYLNCTHRIDIHYTSQSRAQRKNVCSDRDQQEGMCIELMRIIWQCGKCT